MTERQLNWTNTIFVALAHALAAAAVLYLVFVRCSPWTLGVGLLWAVLSGLSVTGGYHRLFAHRSYKSRAPLRALYLAFGSAAVQNSALAWSSDHRVHHEHTDGDDDPYNIQRGFWWAHIGWLFFKEGRPRDESVVADLAADPLIAFQHKHYLALATFFGAVLPALLGLLWGDPLGAVLVAGFLRLVLQWHATFSVNSFAHWMGSRPYSQRTSARDSVWTALISLGEGYHNFHHRFQADYRNGVRWFHFDPTKWFLWSMGQVGLVSDLKRTPAEAIARARAGGG